MNISMDTAFYINSLCSFLALFLMLVYTKKHHKSLSCARCFITYYMLVFLSSFLIAFRDEFGIFLSVIVGNAFTVLGLLYVNRAITKTTKTPFDWKFGLYIESIFIALFMIFTYSYNSILIRIIIVNVAHIVIAIKTIITLQKSKVKFSFTDEFMSITLTLYSMIALSRIVFNLIYIDSSSNFLNYTLDPIFILLISLVNLMFLSGILSLYNNDYVSKYIESERRSHSLISNLPGFAYRCINDQTWTMKYVSKQFQQITGYKVRDIIDNNLLSYNDLIHADYKQLLKRDWNLAIKEKRGYVGEYLITKKDGSTAWLWEQGNPIYESDGSCIYLEGFIMDITTRKSMENNLKFLSYNDTLTNLHNRRYLNIKIDESEKNAKYPISLIMGDINGLKFINDTFGHDYGDKVLVFVANTLLEVIQQLGLTFRISGDEYIIILENTNEVKAKEWIEKIQRVIEKNNPFTFNVSISLGYATTHDSDISLVEVQKKAEDHMYMQKTYAKPSNQRKAIDAVLKTLYEKDKLSEDHSKNVAKYAKRLAKVLGFGQQKIDMVETAALLHDVGKIIVPIDILTSSKRLTKEEYNEIKKHSEIGYRILNSVPELSKVSEIILYHHERIDGKGYPKGLKGKDIPYISKIISICDSYDAMVNVRLYRKPLTQEKAIKELIINKGTQFDSELVDIFIKHIEYINQ